MNEELDKYRKFLSQRNHRRKVTVRAIKWKQDKLNARLHDMVHDLAIVRRLPQLHSPKVTTGVSRGDYVRGLLLGKSIGLGYIPVSFTFGLVAVQMGFDPWVAVFISLTNLASAGQFAGIRMIAGGASAIELAMTTLVVNIRYFLMSLSLTQKIDNKLPTYKRCIMAFSVTDEIFALAAMEKDDVTFVITDLLPHLAAAQMSKTLAKGVTGEQLNLVIGSRPFKDDEESGSVKLNIMSILNKKYGITEADFISAELEAVPAFKARDIGFDRSMIGAYGHDDKVCAYPALIAASECEKPVHTVVTVLTDKEETGSDGNTGLNSSYLNYFIADIAETLGSDARTVLSASECLSADVNAAFDPTFPEVNEKNNSAFINKGVVVTKYTGARGKSGTSDASAEFTGRIRRLMDANNVIWQTGELGKVDEGGGGTVAQYIANLNVDTIDLGVPVLSMHAPYEIVSKIDTYMAYKAFKVFMAD